MGFFDDLIDLPGKVISKSIETAIRLPEVPIKIATGAVEGTAKGVEKLADGVDKTMRKAGF